MAKSFKQFPDRSAPVKPTSTQDFFDLSQEPALAEQLAESIPAGLGSQPTPLEGVG